MAPAGRHAKWRVMHAARPRSHLATVGLVGHLHLLVFTARM